MDPAAGNEYVNVALPELVVAVCAGNINVLFEFAGKMSPGFTLPFMYKKVPTGLDVIFTVIVVPDVVATVRYGTPNPRPGIFVVEVVGRAISVASVPSENVADVNANTTC